MADNPKISVIIPVFNPGTHLYKCLDSIVNQTYKNLEIILVDDGSTDGSERICEDYKQRDCRIQVVHQENAGVSKARNVGIDLATGDYYHFPDSDDYLELDTYEHCLSLIDEHSCDAVVFEHFITYENHEEFHRSADEYYGLYNGKDEIIKLYFRTAFTCNKFFSKKLITGSSTSSGIKFREDIFRGEDSIFSLEALSKATKVWFTNKPFYHYVQSEESACRGIFRLSQLSYLRALDVTKCFFKDNFPQYLPRIEISELQACLMLYSDMYLDEENFIQECDEIYSKFKSLYKNKKSFSASKKQKIKFWIFNINPKLYCKMHKHNMK